MDKKLLPFLSPPLASEYDTGIAPPYIVNPQYLLPLTSLELPQTLALPQMDPQQQLALEMEYWLGLLSVGSSYNILDRHDDSPPSSSPNIIASSLSNIRNSNNNGGEEAQGKNGGMRGGGCINRKLGRARKATPQRVAFHTRSVDDILDDGYRWRKYGQKAVKNSNHPRSYYRCTHHTCNVKKQIQRLATDANIVVTTYEGVHNHPCEKLMETLTPLLRQLQLLSRF